MKRPRKKLICRPFKRGMGRIGRYNLPKLRAEIMDSWGISGSTAWYERMRGKKGLTPCEIEAAERIFAKYGVDKSQIWGCEDGPASTSVED